jgi:mono/diheme cytochrome c family protein
MQGIGLLAGIYLLAWPAIGLADDDDREDHSQQFNIIAAHDSTSRQYDENCLDCHGDVPTQQSLEPTITSIHAVMLPNTPGEETEDKCVFCHRTVDLSTGNQPEQPLSGNLRKRVNVTMCAVCHGPLRPVTPLYQSGPSPTNPDGAALYGLVCEACHRELARSEVEGESAREIQEQINEDEGGMGPLWVLTPEEIQAIAATLARVNRRDDDD